MAIPTIGQPGTQMPGQIDIDQAIQATMQEQLMAEQRRVACLDYAVKSSNGTEGTATILNRAAAFENYVINGRAGTEHETIPNEEGGENTDDEDPDA